MQIFIETIIAWVQSMGWIGVFMGSILEEIIPPIPSTLTQLTYGAILFKGTVISITFFIKVIIMIGIPAAVGVLVGSLPFYAGAFFLGKPFIDRFGKWLGVSWSAVEELDKKFKKNKWDDVVFTGLRATPILPSIVLAVGAGVLRLPIRTYIIGTLIGTFIRASIMGTVGAIVGSQLGTTADTVDKIGMIGFVFLGISCIIGVWWYFKSKKKKLVQK